MDAQSSDGAQKVPLYSINDLKNATDDALAPYLTKLPAPYTFTQSHFYINVRLAVGYLTVLIAAATFYLDWKLGWEATKYYTAGACVLYFVLNAFLTLWIWKFEAGKVFVGFREGGQKLTLQSSVRKHVPIYRLNVLYEAPSGKKWEEKDVEGRFAEWYNEDGFLQHHHLAKWLANNVEVIGKADPRHKSLIEDDAAERPTKTSAEAPSPEAVASGSSKTTKKARRRA